MNIEQRFLKGLVDLAAKKGICIEETKKVFSDKLQEYQKEHNFVFDPQARLCYHGAGMFLYALNETRDHIKNNHDKKV